ncbi:hypothetical protein KJ940_08900 [Myxococcota bacterium]|nr:hypothetical protein [Myxococcota bacterium]
MRPINALFLVSLGLMSAPSAHADLLPSGARAVDHAVIIEGANAWPALRFYLFPTGPSFDRVVPLIPDDQGRIVTRFYHASPPFLFALPAAHPEWATLSRLKPLCSRAAPSQVEIHRSDAPLRQARFVDQRSDVAWVESHYQIEAVGEGRVALRHEVRKRTQAQLEAAKAAAQQAQRRAWMRTEVAQAWSRPPLSLALSPLGLAGVLWLRRRRLRAKS